MLDVAWSELLVIAVVAVVVVGPKDLPKVLRGAAQLMRKARNLTDELKAGVQDLIEEAEIEEVKKSIHHVANFDPRKRLEAYIDPTTGSYVPPSPEGDEPEPLAVAAPKDKPVTPEDQTASTSAVKASAAKEAAAEEASEPDPANASEPIRMNDENGEPQR